jgi:predicted DNA-binding transcriptional regulator YafY
MSFAKAQDLVRLATMAASRRQGVTLDDIREAFGVSHRTAQRMTDALEAAFANVAATDGEDRRRRWRLTDPPPARLAIRPDAAIEALEIAARDAREDNRLRHARALDGVREDLTARLTPRDALRAEADAEAVLAALGHVARPGPRAILSPDVLDTVIEALRGPFRMRMIYGAPDDPPRDVEPHGVLLGPRSYLVARHPARGARLMNFRLDRVLSAECLDESFAMAEGFSLHDYAAQAFGAFHDAGQFGEVIWRFAPHAAARAAEFRFHPRQTLTREPDGALTVRFEAAGWLEMAWHLYQWGDAVEVLAPKTLRALVEGHRRGDFGALP